jgi:hypothetical protein
MLSLPVTPGRAIDLTAPRPLSTTERFKHIEIEINTGCDLSCFSCDRMSDVTNAPNMTTSQIVQFQEESLNLNWEWERIRVLGGEPTLHPQFKEIVGLLLSYRRIYPKCFIQVLSNGHGKLAKYRDWLLDVGVDPHVEAKEIGVTPPWFNNTRITPVDRNPAIGAIEPCGIFGLRGCGIGLTRHGYFMDGAGASIARVAGFDIGVQHLKDVTWESMYAQSKVLCRICGHHNPPDASPTNGKMTTRLVTETGETTGPFWTDKLAAFKKSRPILKVYGEN